MTTLKEYKVMMEGATDALHWIDAASKVIIDEMIINDRCLFYADETILRIHETIHTSLKLTPELIRVIELAEEALLEIEHSDECAQIVATRALSEIRKLKGE